MRGFSFIEIVVSIFIIGLVIVLTTSIIRTEPLNRHARYESVAAKIATNEIEILRAAGYAALPASGVFSDSLLSTIPQGSGTLTIIQFNTNTKQVTATVSWQENGTARTVPVSTLITKVGGLK